MNLCTSLTGLLLCSTLAWTSANELPSYVESRSGRYALETPNYVTEFEIPEGLIVLPEVEYPPLPQWQSLSDRYAPPEPGWFDSSGERFHAAYRKLISSDIKRLEEATKDLEFVAQAESGDASSKWLAISYFWGAQGYTRIYEMHQARKGSNNLEERSIKNAHQSLDKYLASNHATFKTEAQYSKAWLLGKQGLWDDALVWLENTKDDWARHPQISHYFWELEYVLRKNTRAPQAVDSLKQWQLNTPTSKVFLLEARELFLQQEWKQLNALVEERVESFYNAPQTPELMRLHVVADLRESRWESAQSWVERLEKFQGPSDWTLRIHGILAHQRQDWSQALEVLNRMRDPKFRRLQARDMVRSALGAGEYAWILGLNFPRSDLQGWEGEYELARGYAQYRQAKFEAAYEGLRRASQDAKTDEVREWSTYLRSNFDLRKMRWSQAQEQLKQLLADFPDSPRRPEYYFWNAVLLHQQEQDPRFVMLNLRQVPESVERADDRLLLAATLFADQQDWRRVLEQTNGLEQKFPQSPLLEQALLLKSHAHLERLEPEQALSIAERIRQDYPEPLRPVRLAEYQAQALIALKRFEDADAQLKQDVQAHPDFSLVQLRVSTLGALRNDAELARWSSALREDRRLFFQAWSPAQQAWLSFHEAEALFRLQRWEKAFERYQSALQAPPEGSLPTIRYRMAVVYHELQDYSEFLRLAEELLAQDIGDPERVDLLERAGQHALKQGDLEQARPYLEQLSAHFERQAQEDLELNPVERVELLVRAGSLRNTLQTPKEAERSLKTAVQINAQTEDQNKAQRQLRIMREQGTAAFLDKRYSESLAANLKVIYLDRQLSEQESFEVNQRVAESYWALKRETEARAVYQKMLREVQSEELKRQIQARLDQIKKP
jgi:hypothetical protein